MKIQGQHYRSIWPIGEDAFGIIDQAKLPHEFVTMTLRSAEDAARVIRNMNTRGAPLIGVVGAYGLALAVRDDASDDHIQKMVEMLAETRPTAINLKWALWRMRGALLNQPREQRAALAWKEAGLIADEDVAMSEAIGKNGLKIIRDIAAKKPGETVNILLRGEYLAVSRQGASDAPLKEWRRCATRAMWRAGKRSASSISTIARAKARSASASSRGSASSRAKPRSRSRTPAIKSC